MRQTFSVSNQAMLLLLYSINALVYLLSLGVPGESPVLLPLLYASRKPTDDPH